MDLPTRSAYQEMAVKEAGASVLKSRREVIFGSELVEAGPIGKPQHGSVRVFDVGGWLSGCAGASIAGAAGRLVVPSVAEVKQGRSRLLDSCFIELAASMHSLSAEHRLKVAFDTQLIFKLAVGNDLKGSRHARG
jgi:hypothetical protein